MTVNLIIVKMRPGMGLFGPQVRIFDGESDETDEHHIISREQVPGGVGNNQTYKINKSLIKVILHKPDHMRKLAANLVEKKKK